MIKWTKERYKNDPEWLELQRQKENAANRYYYKKKKEKQKDDNTRICPDSNPAQR